MTAQTEREFATYMAENHQFFGLRFDPGPRYNHEWFTPWFDHPRARKTGFELPNDPSGFAHLATSLPFMMHGADFAFWRGGAVWYQDFDVWDHEANVAGQTMIERIRAGYGDLRPFRSATVNIFRDNDKSVLPAFLIAPLIYGWDAYYIPQDRGSFAYICHDGYFAINTETDEAYEALQEQIKGYGNDHWMKKNRVLPPPRFGPIAT